MWRLGTISLILLLLTSRAGAEGVLAPVAPGRSSLQNASMPPEPLREFRAAWIATVANIDWPSKPGLPVAQQKAELITLLDRAAQLHFNAVFFQVRPVSDAFYASSLEPWSEYLTGQQGRAPEPFYDPLAFAISEAHKRGLELHAWFNPFRAWHPDARSSPAANHVSRTRLDLVRHYGAQTLLDPGEPEAQARCINAVQDVVRRYDVDGVVIDDYFYPYPLKNAAGTVLDFPDQASWKRYGIKSGLSRADWRRDNVNRFIQKLGQAVKSVNPKVQFGISPFGIWRPQYPAPIRGLDAYDKVFTDSRKWLASGWVDYFAPQLYWPVAAPEQSFPALLGWWRAQNNFGRHVYAGLYDAKFTAGEIARQMQIIRGSAIGGTGEVHYHLRSVLENPALTAAVKAQYATPAIVPASPWINAVPPEKPRVMVTPGKSAVTIRWEKGGMEPVRWWLVQTCVYNVWTTELIPAGVVGRIITSPVVDAVVVRSVDRSGNLSAPVRLNLPRSAVP